MAQPTQKPNNTMDNRFAHFNEERYCFIVNTLEYAVRCEYVRNTPDCSSAMLFFNYVEAVLCGIQVKTFLQDFVVIFFLVILTAMYVHILLTIGDKYYVPALKVVANKLNMSEHIAGSIIVAFCSCCGNVYISIADQDLLTPLYDNTLATGLFNILVSGGLVCYMKPFRINGNSTMVLVLFATLSLSYLETSTIRDGYMQLEESIILVLVYVGFFAVTITDIVLLKRLSTEYRNELEELRQLPVRDYEREEETERALFNLRELEFTEVKEKDSGIYYTGFTRFTTWKDENIQHGIVDTEATRIALHHPSNSRNRHLISDFLENVKPFDLNNWSQARWPRKIFIIYRIPLEFFCVIMMPRIDAEEPKHGWSKLLYILNILTAPTVFTILLKSAIDGEIILWYLKIDWFVGLYPLLITVPIGIVIWSTSRTDLPPTYQFMFAIMSLITSMLIIIMCDIELKQVSTLVNIVLPFSDEFSGATITAMFTGLSDIVINLTFASHGYEQIAFSASIAAPFLNIILSLGVVFLIQTISGKIKNKGFRIRSGLYHTIIYVFLMLTFTTTLLWATILNFQPRRSIGVYLLTLYFIFILMTILTESEIIHTWEPDINFAYPNF